MSDDGARGRPPPRPSPSRSVFPPEQQPPSRQRLPGPPPQDDLPPTAVQPGAYPPPPPPPGAPPGHGTPPAGQPPPGYGPGPGGYGQQPPRQGRGGQPTPPPLREPEPRGRSGGGALRRPWLGVLVAAAGIAVLWVATQSMNWIDSAGGTLDLTELGFTSDALGQYRVAGWYADWGWQAVTIYVAAVGLLATLVNPSSRAARTVLWFPLVGPLAFFNLMDGEGGAAPRVLGALAMVVPAAVLGGVLADLLVEPEVDPSVASPSELGIDPGALAESGLTQEDLAGQQGLPDPEALRELEASGAVDEVNPSSLASLGLEWQGFATDEIGTGLWASFGAFALVGAGAVIGTRKA